MIPCASLNNVNTVSFLWLLPQKQNQWFKTQWSQHCRVVGKVTTYDMTPAIPYGCRFVSWLLHFWSSSLLMACEKQWKIIQGHRPPASHMGGLDKFLAPGFGIAQPWHLWCGHLGTKPADRRSLCRSLFLSMTFKSIKKIIFWNTPQIYYLEILEVRSPKSGVSKMVFSGDCSRESVSLPFPSFRGHPLTLACDALSLWPPLLSQPFVSMTFTHLFLRPFKLYPGPKRMIQISLSQNN